MGRTKCNTVKRCIDWDSNKYNISNALWRKLEVNCNGTGGKWEAVGYADGDTGDYAKVLPNQGNGVIKEHVCEGGDNNKLKVSKDQLGEGEDLICKHPDT